MRKIFVSVVAIVISIAMIFSLTGCSSSNKGIENLMTEFEYACNTLDFDAVLNCINPKVSDKIKIATGFVGMFTDTDTDEMFESLSDYLSSDDIGGTDFFSSIKIEVKDISVEDEAATVAAILTYELNGEEVVRESTFNCIYYTEKWYISSFSIN